jgi:2-desacetyl-2-hydroxyethyl bacteriochlorophyllide A dehydrogenase
VLEYIEIASPYRAALIRAPLSPPRAGEGLVETVLSGISAGTERMWLQGTAGALRSGRRGYPYRPGYALVGRVVEIGPGFDGPPPGARLFAMKPHGSHATLLAGDRWFELPDHVKDEDAVGIALTATALHAVHRSSMTVGDGAVVAGLGVLGLVLIEVLAASFAGPVIAVTASPAKRQIALDRGATRALLYDELADANLTPVQCVFDCTGVAANVAGLLELARPQGEIVLVGFYTEPITVDGEALFARELTIKSVRATGGVASGNEYDRWDRGANLALAGRLIASGKVRPRSLVTHRFAASRFEEAYQLISDPERRRAAIQVCLDWQTGREAA